MALLQVALVTVGAAVVIAGLMSLSNWCFTPVGETEEPTASRKALGFALIGVIVVIVLFGLYLMIPYFH
ncbi:MAG: hypothetical protein FWD75_00140 [Propionibacteriaceae bacterium]|nr:hypothetical protein [Propionibacteriaceae bacterium]